MSDRDSGGVTVSDSGTTDTSSAKQPSGGPTDSTGAPTDELFAEADGDTSGLPSRVDSLELTQSRMQEYITDLRRKNRILEERIASVERENDAILSLSERISALEDITENMERSVPDNTQRLDPPYPSFASFSLRAAIASTLFIGLFWTLYSQGTLSEMVFGAILAFLSVIGIASVATWYKLK